MTAMELEAMPRSFPGRFKFGSHGWLPLWVLLLLAAVLGAALWPRWSRRFSLRTLLIAMTVIAAALGVIAASL